MTDITAEMRVECYRNSMDIRISSTCGANPEPSPIHLSEAGFVLCMCPAGSGGREANLFASLTGIEPVVTRHGSTALVDGYALGVSLPRLVEALEAFDDDFLNRVNGHYSALIIKRGGDILGFRDRLGGRALYWHASEEHGLVIASRWKSMPIYRRDTDETGLAEMLRYRWTSGRHTLSAATSQLPLWHRVCFRNDASVSILPTNQQVLWPDVPPVMSFDEHVEHTRSALTSSIVEVAEYHDKAAIFLSGGVDSSLLAALAKQAFAECLLVTPIFPGRANPELQTAKAFAKTLGLEHLLVPVDEAQLESDFMDLTEKKGGQVNFHQLAMHQLIRATPEAYRLLIFGEAADTLFGYNGFLQSEKRLRWKQLLNLLPSALVNAISRLPSRKAEKLARLRQESLIDIALDSFIIDYDPLSLKVIRGICKSDLANVYAHRAVASYLCSRPAAPDRCSLRALLQHLTLQCLTANHVHEAELSASGFDKLIFSPYLSRPVIDAASYLGNACYFGNRWSKPVLRALASEHYNRNLIYRKKLGFEVPFTDWLDGPLSSLVEALRAERRLFDGRMLETFDPAAAYSLFWSLMSWQVCHREISTRIVTNGPEQARSTPATVATPNRRGVTI